VYASAQKFVDSLKKSAVKTEPMLNPDRVQRVNMESLLGKRFFVVVHIPLLFLTLYSPPLIFLFLLFFVSFVSVFPFFLPVSLSKSVLVFSGADLGPGSGAFLTTGSGIGFSRSRVPDPQPIFLSV
jgi:hypothetical protein